MALSIKEQIVVNYQTALGLISVANGYERNIDDVSRFQSRGMDQNLNTIIELKQGSDIPNEELSSFGNEGLEGHTLTMHTVVKFRHDPETDAQATNTIGNAHEQDVYKAVMIDRARGGLAFDTRWTGTDEIELDEDGNRAIMAVNFEIDYRHVIGDMTQ